jgi:hypothetical protein
MSITSKLGVIDSQFYMFLRLCSSGVSLVSQMVTAIVCLKTKSCEVLKI